jgi:ubiquinone/menaquinone biosynthesis C-methylase UbiE
MANKNNIKRDLEAKGADYLRQNYLIKTRQNFLRRLRRHMILEGLAEVKNGASVLDIGCGPAIIFPEILRIAKNYVAVDLVSSNLEQIRKNNQNENLILIEADFDDFAWDHDYFDVIICSGTIEYTEDPERNLLRLFTFLKKGGLMVCSFPNKASPYRLWSEYVYRHIWRIKNILLKKEFYSYQRKLFSKRKIISVLTKSLKPEELNFSYFGHKFIIQPLDILMGGFDYKLTEFLHKHPIRWLRPFCSEFLLWLKK